MTRQCASTAYLSEIEAPHASPRDEDRCRCLLSQARPGSTPTRDAGSNALFAASRSILPAMKSSPLYGLDADANDRTHAGAGPQSEPCRIRAEIGRNGGLPRS